MGKLANMSDEERKAYNREKSARYRARHPDRIREKNRRDREADLQKNDPDYQREYRKTYYERPEIKRRRRCAELQRKYGITLETYERMLKEQNGTCKICGGEPKVKSLHVDHCHTSGKIRGLLCTSCNTTIGKEENSPGLLQGMLEYIEEHK